jgi:hypothetical protein
MKNSSDNGSIKVLGYLGIFFLLLFMILPPLFRVLFPEEEPVVEKEKLIMNLTCIKTEEFEDYKVKITINTNYVDGEIHDSKFNYEVISNDEFFDGRVKIEEYDALKKVSNVDFEEKDNKYILTINYSKFDYSNEPLLQEHNMMISQQSKKYSDNNFECSTEKVQG